MSTSSSFKALSIHYLVNFILTTGITYWLCTFFVPSWISALIAIIAAVLEGKFFNWTNHHFVGRHFVNFLDNVMYWPGQIIFGSFPAVKIARWFICIATIPAFLAWQHFVFHDIANSAMATLTSLLLLSLPIRFLARR